MMADQQQGYEEVAKVLKRAGHIVGVDRFRNAVAIDNEASRALCINLERFRTGHTSLTTDQWYFLWEMVGRIIVMERDRTGDTMGPER